MSGVPPSSSTPQGTKPTESAPPPDWAKFLIENEPAVGAYIDRIARHFLDSRDREWKHRESADRAAAVPGFVIILVVFGLMGIALALTYQLVSSGRLSGETFVFFIGALLGSLITFLAERIVPLLYPTEEEAE